MKRDNDYIRELLFRYEESSDWMHFIPDTDDGEGDSREKYHVYLMMDDGLLTRLGADTMRMTSRGHDFLDAIRSDTIWNKTKDGAKTVGGATLGMFRDIALAYIRQEAAQRLGIDI